MAAVAEILRNKSPGFANRALRKGGRAVIVGLFGGRFSMPRSRAAGSTW